MSATDLIDAYLQHLVELGRSDLTIRDRREILGRLDTDLPEGLDSATDDEIRKWVHRPGWSNQTKATYVSAVQSFFRFCCDPRIGPYLDYNPAASCPRPSVPRGVPRPVTDEQLARILQRAPANIRLWALVAAYEGARCIEISRLDREHVNQENTLLYGKGSKYRSLPTHPDFWATVRDLPDGPIARTPKGVRADPQFISSRAKLCFDRIGLHGVTMHRLRHWHGTRIHEIARDIRVTQTALGHASVTSTQVYTAVADSRIRDAFNQLPRFTSDPQSSEGDADAA